MSWEPVTLWAVRCDGETTQGQCAQTYHYPADDEDDAPTQALYLTRDLGSAIASGLHLAGWLTAGTRVLCPAHVDAAVYLAAAEVDGLPFGEEISQ